MAEKTKMNSVGKYITAVFTIFISIAAVNAEENNIDLTQSMHNDVLNELKGNTERLFKQGLLSQERFVIENSNSTSNRLVGFEEPMDMKSDGFSLTPTGRNNSTL